jgi:hypothetical protein
VTLFHPSLRLPTWAAVGIVAAAYFVRSAMRGWDFRPDLPVDAVILLVLAVILALRWYLQRQGWDRREGAEEGAPEGDPPRETGDPGDGPAAL